MKYKILVSLYLIGCVMLTGCSYKKIEDNIMGRNEIPEEYEETYVNKIDLQEQESIVETEDNNAEDDETQNVYNIGEKVVVGLEHLQREIEVKNVQFVDDLKKVNIENDELIDSSMFNPDGSIKDGQYAFVLVTINIRNIDYDVEIFDADYMSMGDAIGFKKDVLDEDGPFLLYPVYFNEHNMNSSDSKDTSYFHYELNIGNEKELKIGWILPKERIDTETLYYVSGNESGNETMKFIVLSQ